MLAGLDEFLWPVEEENKILKKQNQFLKKEIDLLSEKIAGQKIILDMNRREITELEGKINELLEEVKRLKCR